MSLILFLIFVTLAFLAFVSFFVAILFAIAAAVVFFLWRAARGEGD